MWIVSLEWLLLAVLVFWCIGAYKRLKRLRAEVKQAFAGVETQLLALLALLRDCARMQELKDRVSGTPTPQAHHALLPSAHLLETALVQAVSQPLQPPAIAALDAAWQGAQVAWQAYVHQSVGRVDAQAGPDASMAEWDQRWQHLCTLHGHSTAQFNASVHNYNGAIAQFPACLVARIRGFQAGRPFQKDAALPMQPSA